MDWLAGLFGALIGAGAAFGGVVYSERRAADRAAEVLRRDRVRAARAWRDDFHTLENRLADYAFEVPRGWSGTLEELWHPLGTDADLLLLSPLFQDGNEWGGLSAGRRHLLLIVDRWRRGPEPSDEEIRDAFKWMETARLQLASVDKWPFDAHKDADRISQL